MSTSRRILSSFLQTAAHSPSIYACNPLPLPSYPSRTPTNARRNNILAGTSPLLSGLLRNLHCRHHREYKYICFENRFLTFLSSLVLITLPSATVRFSYILKFPRPCHVTFSNRPIQLHSRVPSSSLCYLQRPPNLAIICCT